MDADKDLSDSGDEENNDEENRPSSKKKPRISQKVIELSEEEAEIAASLPRLESVTTSIPVAAWERQPQHGEDAMKLVNDKESDGDGEDHDAGHSQIGWNLNDNDVLFFFFSHSIHLTLFSSDVC